MRILNGQLKAQVRSVNPIGGSFKDHVVAKNSDLGNCKSIISIRVESGKITKGMRLNIGGYLVVVNEIGSADLLLEYSAQLISILTEIPVETADNFCPVLIGNTSGRERYDTPGEPVHLWEDD